MQVISTDALEQAVIKNIILISLCFFIVSCENSLGLSNSQLYVWAENNDQLLNGISYIGVESSVSGDVKKLSDSNRITGSFKSIDDEKMIKSYIEKLYEVSPVSELELTFNLGRESSHKSIYITFYKDGFCASFGNCLKTYLVYYMEENDLINEKNYHYIATNVKGWYILKVEN